MRQPMTGEKGEQISRFELGNLKVNMPRPSYFKKILTIVKLLIGSTLLILSIQGIQRGNLVTGIRSAKLTWLALAISMVPFG